MYSQVAGRHKNHNIYTKYLCFKYTDMQDKFLCNIILCHEIK